MTSQTNDDEILQHLTLYLKKAFEMTSIYIHLTGLTDGCSPAVVIHELTIGIRALHPLSFTQNQIQQRHAKLTNTTSLV